MLYWILYNTVLMLHTGCMYMEPIKACWNSGLHENLFLTHFSMTTTHHTEWCHVISSYRLLYLSLS